MIIFVLLLLLGIVAGHFPGKGEILYSLQALNAWAWILTLIGYAATYLNKPSKTLKYANEAVYPFYILHQTVIIALGYYLKNIEMSLFVKFSIMVIGTFGISWLIYEFGIRRFAWIRPLFGMKKK
jgi:peptidoglycan/LPS O-acetylase OafA/YrhL